MERIEILRGFHSEVEGFPRVVRVFTPRQYDEQPGTRFGLIVMHDGQNVFEHPESACFPTWAADRTLQGLMDEGRVGPWIIVAVDHSLGRFEDFSPWPEPRAGVTGRGQIYARFLIEQLLPWAHRRYRLREGPQWTATIGSSLGGLISLYLGLRHPDVFGRIGALSPSVMWCHDAMFREWKAHTRKWTKIWLDAGEHEVFHRPDFPMLYGERVHDFFHHLESLGYAPHEVRFMLEPGGTHSEGAWQRRLPWALEWLLN